MLYSKFLFCFLILIKTYCSDLLNFNNESNNLIENDFYINFEDNFDLKNKEIIKIEKKENFLPFYKKTYRSFMADNPSWIKQFIYKAINKKEYRKFYLGTLGLLSFYGIRNFLLYPFIEKINKKIENQPGGSKKVVFDKVSKYDLNSDQKNLLVEKLNESIQKSLLHDTQKYIEETDNIIKSCQSEINRIGKNNKDEIETFFKNYENLKNPDKSNSLFNQVIDLLKEVYIPTTSQNLMHILKHPWEIKREIKIDNLSIFAEIDLFFDNNYEIKIDKKIIFDNNNSLEFEIKKKKYGFYIQPKKYCSSEALIKMSKNYINNKLKSNSKLLEKDELFNSIYNTFVNISYELKNQIFYQMNFIEHVFKGMYHNFMNKKMNNFSVDMLSNYMAKKDSLLMKAFGYFLYVPAKAFVIGITEKQDNIYKKNFFNNYSYKLKYDNYFHYYTNELVNNSTATLFKLAALSTISTKMFLMGNKIFRYFVPNKNKFPPLEIHKPNSINVGNIKDIGGLFIMKNELLDIVNKVNSRLNSSEKEGMGIVLHGGPGTGKTLSAKILAKELGYSMMYVDSAAIIPNSNSSYSIHSAINYIFETAKKIGNCVILFDEFDRIIKTQEVLAEILRLLDVYLKTTNIIFIATTNNINNFNEALLRPGRLNRIIFVDSPSINERIDMFKKLFESYQLKIENEILFKYFAKMSQNFSSAMIVELMSNIQDVYLQYNISNITKKVFDNAYIKVILGEQYKGLQVDEAFKNKIALLLSGELYHSLKNDLTYSYNIAFATINHYEKNYNRENFSGTIYKIYKDELNKNKDKKEIETELESLIIKIAIEEIYLKNKSTTINTDKEIIDKLIKDLITLDSPFNNENEVIKKSNEIYLSIYNKVYKLLNTDEYKNNIDTIYKLLKNNDVVFGNEILNAIKVNNSNNKNIINNNIELVK